MMGLLAELAGATLSGTIVIYLIGMWRAKSNDSFSGPSIKAFSGTAIGWLAMTVLRIWGSSPNSAEMLISPVFLLPSFAIAFFLVRHRMLKIERESEIPETFE